MCLPLGYNPINSSLSSTGRPGGGASAWRRYQQVGGSPPSTRTTWNQWGRGRGRSTWVPQRKTPTWRERWVSASDATAWNCSVPLLNITLAVCRMIKWRTPKLTADTSEEVRHLFSYLPSHTQRDRGGAVEKSWVKAPCILLKSCPVPLLYDAHWCNSMFYFPEC